jgi:hypothetical protein
MLREEYTTSRIHGCHNNIYITGIIFILLSYLYHHHPIQKTKEVMLTEGFKNLHTENPDIFSTIIHRIAATLP